MSTPRTPPISIVLYLVAYGTPIKPVNAAGMALRVIGMYLMGR